MVGFTLSPNIAIEVPDPESTARALATILGLKPSKLDEHTFEFHPPDRFVYIGQNEAPRVVLELFVDDLERAKAHILELGWEIVDWQGLGKKCYVRDTSGTYFNLWQRP